MGNTDKIGSVQASVFGIAAIIFSINGDTVGVGMMGTAIRKGDIE
jgi:hypothetical protein